MPSAQEIVKSMTMDAAQTLCKDATYIPEEMLGWKPMDHGKSANEILSECAQMNYRMVAAVKGEPPTAADEGQDFSALKACVVASAEAVCSVIDSLGDADLEGEVQMPWGTIMSMAEAIVLPASHMVYHDGQINYIQLLLGDTKFHWAEG